MSKSGNEETVSIEMEGRVNGRSSLLAQVALEMAAGEKDEPDAEMMAESLLYLVTAVVIVAKQNTRPEQVVKNICNLLMAKVGN